MRYGSQIRRRVRGKLRASMRRLFDSQDILSTLGRRLDEYVYSGGFEARSEGELWSLVFKIAERSVAEKARHFESLTGNESGGFRAASQAQRFDRVDAHDDESPELEDLLAEIPSEPDRQIARLWSRGMTSEMIAVEVKMTPHQVRQRWIRTRDRLRARFGGEGA